MSRETRPRLRSGEKWPSLKPVADEMTTEINQSWPLGVAAATESRNLQISLSSPG
jgi:hypothetical protein